MQRNNFLLMKVNRVKRPAVLDPPKSRGFSIPSILDHGSVVDSRKLCGSEYPTTEERRLACAWRDLASTEVRPTSRSASIFQTQGGQVLQCQYLELAFSLLTQPLSDSQFSFNCGSFLPVPEGG